MSTLGKLKSALTRNASENLAETSTKQHDADIKINIIDADPLHEDIINDVIDRARANADALEVKVEYDATEVNAPTAGASAAIENYTHYNADLTPEPSPIPIRSMSGTPAPQDPPRNLGPARKTDNLSHIRSDLAQLNEDMSSGEQFYAQSLKRINNLIDYAYETEANLSALEHLEPENRRLTSELEQARKKANDETLRAETQKSKAEAYESRYLDVRQSLEKSQLSLTKLETERESLERQIADKEVEISGLTNSNRTIRNDLAVDRQTQEKLSSKNLALSSELSVALSEKLELEKRNVEYSGRLEQLAAEHQELERMLTTTRSAQKATEELNITLKTEMEQVLADVQIFKQQFDSSTRTRDSEIHGLRAKVSDLETELSIKSDVVSHAHDEMTELRGKHDAAQRGRRNLLDHIEKQKSDADILREAHDSAKAEVKNYSSQIFSLRAEIDELRRLNTMQSDKLKRYLAINSMPASAEPGPTMRARSTVAPTHYVNTSQMASPSTNRMPPPPASKPSEPAPVIHARKAATTAQAAPADLERPNDGRTIPKAQLESARYGMVGGISSSHGMTATSAEREKQAEPAISDEFDREFETLAAPAAPKKPSSVSQAQDIDETLGRFHEIDLLDIPQNTASDRQVR